ncbi:MAG: DUF4118 domain-containing protein [Lachnospiraceae bacterium]|nr:DUF4118 domain-containing protein [Lachnospiraceae bacterium]
MRKKNQVLYNILITAGILVSASLICIIMQQFSESDTHVPLLFVLAVLFISRFTDGYLYGIVASMIAVVGVNYVFTYPYFEINFNLAGYPLTFVVMLAVACSVSALTTQIKRQEQIRLEVEKEKMRGNLLRAVSHDIRTPLTSMMGAASVLSDNYEDLTDEERKEFAGNMKAEAQWLIRIVENLLTITRIENGDNGTQIVKEEELVEEIVSSAVLKFKKRFPNVEIVVKMPEELLLVPMDGVLIEQVLVNLLENAVFHGKTTSKVEIRVVEQENRVFFFVEDNGDGIREAVLPHINDNRILRVNMANIRRKIEKNPAEPQYIFTEVGVGYRIVESDRD